MRGDQRLQRAVIKAYTKSKGEMNLCLFPFRWSRGCQMQLLLKLRRAIEIERDRERNIGLSLLWMRLGNRHGAMSRWDRLEGRRWCSVDVFFGTARILGARVGTLCSFWRPLPAPRG